MSMRKDWEAEKKKLETWQSAPAFEGDFGEALDATRKPTRRWWKWRAAKKEISRRRNKAYYKAGEAALIARTYVGILEGLTTTPMQKSVVDGALYTITGMLGSMGRKDL